MREEDLDAFGREKNDLDESFPCFGDAGDSGGAGNGPMGVASSLVGVKQYPAADSSKLPE